MFFNFSELNNYYFSVSNIYAERQISNGKTKFTMSRPRHTDAILFFSNTVGVCYQDKLPPLYVPQGALVYLPQGCQYIWENSPAANEEFQENLLFEFTLNHINTEFTLNHLNLTATSYDKKIYNCSQKSGERICFGNNVSIISTRHTSLYRNLLLSLIDAFNKETLLPLQLYSIIYNIFNTISENCLFEKKNYVDTDVIKDSIKYLEAFKAPTKSIKEIASSCHYSIGHYERLFNSYMGVSPTEYRNICRINYIKSLLHNPQITLEEIASSLGYCDSGYLCRVFKKKTGMTPKEYRKIYISQIQSEKLEKR